MPFNCVSLRRLPLAAGAAAILAFTPPGVAHADEISHGGDARTLAMGGAGLALPYGGGQRLNPASIAYERSALGLSVPSTTIISDGLSTNNISSALANGNASEAATLLRQYASTDRTVGLNAGLSVRISKLEISVDGASEGYIEPNGALAAWATAGGGPPSTIPLNSRIDLIAGGYAAAGAATGFTLPVPSDTAANYSVGLKAKYMVGAYSHFIADSSVLTTSADAEKAPEMGNSDYLNKYGIGADLGFYRQPRGGQGLGEAIVINDIVNPNLTFQGTDRFGNPAAYKITATTINAGIGWVSGATALAADLDDIAAATGKAELRLGAEEKLGGALGLRAGYSSVSGYTYGAGLLGFGVAAGKHLPLEVTKTLKF